MYKSKKKEEVIVIGFKLKEELIKLQETFGLRKLSDVIELLMYHFDNSKSVSFDALMYFKLIKEDPSEEITSGGVIPVESVLRKGLGQMTAFLGFTNINDLIELVYYHFENSESFSRETLMYLSALKDEERNIELSVMSDERFEELLNELKS